MDAKLEACLERQITEMEEMNRGAGMASQENRDKFRANMVELKEIVDGLPPGEVDKIMGEQALRLTAQLLEKNERKFGDGRC